MIKSARLSVLTRTREWFLLRDLESRAAKVPPEVASKSVGQFRLSNQRRGAAEALWVAGYPSDALRTLADAIAIAREATSSEPKTYELPLLDDEITKEHAGRFREMLAEHTRLCRDHAELAHDRKEIASKRRMRAIGAIAGAFAAVALIYLVVRTPRTLKATASGMYDGRYDPINATDGNESTDWLLPDRVTGWIEVQVLPPRNLSRVKLLNARNVPYNDRATNEFRVEAFSNGKVVKSADGKFDGFAPEPVWRTIELGGQRVDRIRIEVKSFHLSGGGFGEIEVD